MEQATKSKFIFLLVAGIVMLGVAVYTYVSTDKQQEAPAELSDQDYTYTSLSEETMTEDEIAETTMPIGQTEVDYEAVYTERFGEDKVKEAKQLAEMVIQSWLEQNADMEMWAAISTDSFLFVIENEVLAPRDEVTRKVKKVDVSLANAVEEQDIQWVVYTTWDVLAEGKVVKEQSNMYELTMTLSADDKWLVKELNRV